MESGSISNTSPESQSDGEACECVIDRCSLFVMGRGKI